LTWIAADALYADLGARTDGSFVGVAITVVVDAVARLLSQVAAEAAGVHQPFVDAPVTIIVEFITHLL